MGWLRMRVWKTSLRRMKSAIFSWAGSYIYIEVYDVTPYKKFCIYQLTKACFIDIVCLSHYELPFYKYLLSTFEPSHEIMALFVLRKHSLNALVQLSVRARCPIFGPTLPLLPYFMCANREGSGETVRMRRLAWAFAGRLCDKYHNLISWHI